MQTRNTPERRRGIVEGVARTTAQGFSLIAGSTLVAVGVLALLLTDSSFGSGGSVDGHKFLFFEMNGWHEVLYLASGGALILASAAARTAISGLVAMGMVYALVTAWGFIDGSDVANVIAVDDAANWLHLGLSVSMLGVAAAGAGLFSASRTGGGRPLAHPG